MNELTRLTNFFDSVYGDDNLWKTFLSSENLYRRDHVMKYDEKEQKYFFLLDIPGFSKTDIKVRLHIDSNYIEISGNQQSKNVNYRQYVKTFNRKIQVPNDLDENSLEVYVENGQLRLEGKVLEQNKKPSVIEIPIK